MLTTCREKSGLATVPFFLYIDLFEWPFKPIELLTNAD